LVKSIALSGSRTDSLSAADVERLGRGQPIARLKLMLPCLRRTALPFDQSFRHKPVLYVIAGSLPTVLKAHMLSVPPGPGNPDRIPWRMAAPTHCSSCFALR